MCSIGGFLAAEPLPAEYVSRLTRALLWYGRERGNQSAGVCIGGNVVKRAQAVDEFMFADEYTGACVDARWSLTHTRNPTCGGLGDEQAQPFRIGKTATVHNGYYFNLKEIKDKFRIAKASGVDSELVTAFVHTHGARSLPKFLEFAEGASAIATMSRGRMYLARGGNPLVVAFVNWGTNRIAVFGSTKKQVEWACRHSWLMPQKWESEELDDDALYTLSPTQAVPVAEFVTPAYTSRRWTYSDDYKSLSEYKPRGHWDDARETYLVPCAFCHKDHDIKTCEYYDGEYYCAPCLKDFAEDAKADAAEADDDEPAPLDFGAATVTDDALGVTDDDDAPRDNESHGSWADRLMRKYQRGE